MSVFLLPLGGDNGAPELRPEGVVKGHRVSLQVQVPSLQVSSALRMRSIELVERSEPITERNIAFREHLGP